MMSDRPSAEAVARIARKVRYEKTCQPTMRLAKCWVIQYSTSVPALAGARTAGERVHHALEPVDTRTLYEQAHVGPAVRQRPAQGRGERWRVAKRLGAGAEALGRERRERAERVQALDAVLTGKFTHIGMRADRMLTELGHVAQDQPAPAA